MNEIKFIGCREGNLKNIDVSFPYGKITAVTGVSGSGKSSFAFNTVYSEGRRQFLEILDPSEAFYLSKSCSSDFDMAIGLPPTVAVRQIRNVSNPLSTVGSVSHINSFLFAIFSSVGQQSCTHCQKAGLKFYTSAYMPCPSCGVKPAVLPPSFFSNMSPNGMCQTCGGEGVVVDVDETKIYPDQELSLNEGGFLYGIPTKGTTKYNFFKSFVMQYGATMDTPIKYFSNELKVALLYGVQKSKKNKIAFDGIVNEIFKTYKTTTSSKLRQQLSQFFTYSVCEDCNGAGISRLAQNILIEGKNICDVQNMTIFDLYRFLKNIHFGDLRDDIISIPLGKILDQCEVIINLGISYLSLSRKTASLSGGEMHRLFLSTLISNKMSGVLYILDEPSTGLHYCEIPNLIREIKALQQAGNGNTVLLVEHNPQLIDIADNIIEFGPGASYHGGEIVYNGAKEGLKDTACLTEKLLSKQLKIERSRPCGYDLSDFIGIRNANSNNLKNVSVDIPLHCVVAITGISGSGKSSLVFDSLVEYGKINKQVSKTRTTVQAEIVNSEKVAQIILCSQSPIGNNSRSVVATYSEIMPDIRKLFADTEDAEKQALDETAFSFNTAVGACPQCGGFGKIKLSNYFVSNSEIKCPCCEGRRFNSKILGVKYHGKNISEILDLDVDTACDFFDEEKKIQKKLELLKDVSLGYLRLGQNIVELSGGESQRLKLAGNLMNSKFKNVLYIFDEPSAGLHSVDIQNLVFMFEKLIAEGNSIIIVEHNMELIACSDYIIDMGPGAGKDGGAVVATGTAKEVAATNTVTGKSLRQFV
ncbi:MAG: ATP-binding cassette domain-containing protein [Clostridiales bacterium]|nr:ATP-binding cassette domain-containing protein [Clostridiales bacterium]